MNEIDFNEDSGSYYPKMWDFFISQLNIKSILDIGCKHGKALSFFIDRCNALGVEKFVTDKNLVKNFVICHDFSIGVINPEMFFDMIWCSDFVETLKEESYDNFLTTIALTQANYIFLSYGASQHSSYWISKLDQYGYELNPRLTRMARSIVALDCESDRKFISLGLVFTKKKSEYPKQDAIITWCGGNEFCKSNGVKAFVNSLNSCGFNGDKIIFTHEMELEDREYFITRGFKIIDCNPKDINVIIRDRFLIWANFLATASYRYVCLLDCKDVIFQKDPIIFLEKLNKKLCFVAEGKKHKECSWNDTDQRKLQQCTKHFQLPYMNWDVICGGTILGLTQDVRHLISQIWSTTLVANTSCSDQAVLNFLYNTFYKNDITNYVADPKYSSLCATADLPKEVPPVFKNGLLYHSILDETYYLLHQWDRVEEYKHTLLEKYT